MCCVVCCVLCVVCCVLCVVCCVLCVWCVWCVCGVCVVFVVFVVCVVCVVCVACVWCVWCVWSADPSQPSESNSAQEEPGKFRSGIFWTSAKMATVVAVVGGREGRGGRGRGRGKGRGGILVQLSLVDADFRKAWMPFRKEGMYFFGFIDSYFDQEEILRLLVPSQGRILLLGPS